MRHGKATISERQPSQATSLIPSFCPSSAERSMSSPDGDILRAIFAIPSGNVFAICSSDSESPRLLAQYITHAPQYSPHGATRFRLFSPVIGNSFPQTWRPSLEAGFALLSTNTSYKMSQISPSTPLESRSLNPFTPEQESKEQKAKECKGFMRFQGHPQVFWAEL
jgi:hypothetical protein